MNATETPLLSALAQAAQRDHAAFYAPGHKQGQGIPDLFKTLLGAQVFQADLPELPELDNLFAPEGPIQQAQQLAAETFGAEKTFFLANGSTCGIEAAVLAVCSPGDKILVPRNAHRSVVAALILSGAKPVFLSPTYDKRWDLAYGVTPEQVEWALKEHPDMRAVLVVSPSYQGICSDIAAIANLVHARSCVLIVDEAHGPHLSFHDQLPQGAIAGGADLVIQSTHKVLAALTQASMLHVQGTRVDCERLRQALQLTQSTSPNYLLLASLDAARYQMAMAGTALMEKTLAIANQVRSQLLTLASLQCLTSECVAQVSSHFHLDCTRLTVDVSALGMTGFAADELLHEHLEVTAELPTLRQLTFIFSLGNTTTDGDRLLSALTSLVEKAAMNAEPSLSLPSEVSLSCPTLAEPPITPRDAFFAKSRVVAIAEAVGHISADTLCPYPPGIPVLLPGERITSEAIAYLQHIHVAGGVITGIPDSNWRALRIVDMPGNN